MSDDQFRHTFEGSHCLITGGLGFIGSNLAHRLVDLGANVVIIDSLLPEYGGNLINVKGIEERIRVNIADVRDIHSMQYLVQGHDYLFNLAGQVSHIDSMENPFNDLDINCRAQLSILESCRKYNNGVNIVFASTRQIYGKPDYVPVDERHLLHPTDVNGINKMAGEWYHILYHNVYGMHTSALRMTNTYGPRMLVKHARQTALGWFIRQALDDETISIYGDGHQQRDYTYVDDVVEALLIAAQRPEANGKVYNLGGDRPIDHLELIQTLIEVAGTGSYKLIPFPPEKARIDIGSVYSDYGLIKSALGWEPKTGLREGLATTLDFYRQYREHYW